MNERINELLSENGAHVDAFYYCPHLPGAPVKEYDVECDCRKPKLGMFKKAIEDYNLDPKLCFACGDKARDVEGLVELGVLATHTGITDGKEEYGHFRSLVVFCNAMIS